MNNTNLTKLGITLAGVLAHFFLPARVQANALAYTVTDLANFDGNQSHTIFGINASGQLAGYLSTGSGDHAVRWNGATTTNLDSLGGSNSYGFAINVSGQIAGSSDLAGDNSNHAVRWTGTIPTDLGTLGGTKSYGRGINDSGQVAGEAYFSGNANFHAVRWTGTTAEDLGTLHGFAGASKGNAINASGQVAGWSTLDSVPGGLHAVRWTGTAAEDLGTLGGTSSLGHDINASGQVVGYSYLAGNSGMRAVRWTGTVAENLGTLVGGTSSEAYSINAAGDVIGMSDTTNNGINGGYDAFLYTDGKMYDLTTLLLPGSGVTSLRLGVGANINDLGQIAAGGLIGGEFHVLILTPVTVPEPSSSLFLLGSGWMWLLQRRRRPGL